MFLARGIGKLHNLQLCVLRKEIRALPLLRIAAVKPCCTDAGTKEKPSTNEPLPARLVAAAPKSVQPYLKLARYDRPIGTWLLYWPCTWGIATAAEGFPDLPMLVLFGTGALVMRGAGCTINDMWDRDIDPKVTRTSQRPLVTGEISMKQAWVFLAGQLSVGLIVLLQLNWFSVFLGASSMALVCIYPLMKRITNWPQLVLGFTFNWGALLGFSAIQNHINPLVCIPLYLAGICWTIIYDTIYAHQDKTDDLRLGIKSTALHFGDSTKTWLTSFSTGMVANLLISGLMNDQTFPYYISVGLIAAHLASQIKSLNINNPTDCSEKFISNSQIGLLLFCGIVLGTLYRNVRNQNNQSGIQTLVS